MCFLWPMPCEVAAHSSRALVEVINPWPLWKALDRFSCAGLVNATWQPIRPKLDQILWVGALNGIESNDSQSFYVIIMFFYYDFNTCLWFLMISNDLGKERWRGCEGPRSRGYSAICCWMFRLSGQNMFDEDNLFWSVLVEFVTRSQEWDGGGVSHATITYNYIQLPKKATFCHPSHPR